MTILNCKNVQKMLIKRGKRDTNLSKKAKSAMAREYFTLHSLFILKRKSFILENSDRREET